MRIVSLIASAAEIVHTLGLTSCLVGRSHECDYPQEILTLPVCTRPTIAVDGSSAAIDALVRQRIVSAISVYEVFSDVLNLLQPTHIITQTHCRVCAVSLDDVERALGADIASRPKLVSLEPNSLADILTDIRRVADACGVPERGDEVVRDLEGTMKSISEACHRENRRPRVACIEWLEPLMASGNWIPKLIELANGENLYGEAGQHSPYMSWEQFVASDPDVILVSPCGFDLERTRREMYWLSDRPEWTNLKAVRSQQVYLIDGNEYMNRPSPRVAESLRIMAEILHPAVFAPTLERAYERAITTSPKNRTAQTGIFRDPTVY